jgi:hypothetical protein
MASSKHCNGGCGLAKQMHTCTGIKAKYTALGPGGFADEVLPDAAGAS